MTRSQSLWVARVLASFGLAIAALLIGRIEGRLTPATPAYDVERALIRALSLTPVGAGDDALSVIAIITPLEAGVAEAFERDLRSVRQGAPVTAIMVMAGEEDSSGPILTANESQLLRRRAPLLRVMRDIGGGMSRWIVLQGNDVRAGGTFRHGGLVAAVERVRGVAPDVKQAITASMQALLQAGDLPMRSSESKFILIVDDISSGCPAFYVLKDLQNLLRDRHRDVNVMVPALWQPEEVEAMRANLGISLPIQRLGTKASGAWEAIVRRFGAQVDDGVLLVVRPDTLEVVIDPPAMTARLREDL